MVRSPWGFFELKVAADPADPRRLEVHMHMRIEKIRVEKEDFARFLQFQDEVSRSYRVWLTLHPSSQIADAPELEKLLARGKPDEVQTVKVLAKLYLDHDRSANARRSCSKRGPPGFPMPNRSGNCACTPPPITRKRSPLSRHGRSLPGRTALCGRSRGGMRPPRRACRGQNHSHPFDRRSRQHDPRAAYYQLARSADRQHDSAAALKYLQQALFHDPPALATMEAMQFRDRVQENLGLFKEALQTLATALQADPAACDVLDTMIRLDCASACAKPPSIICAALP